MAGDWIKMRTNLPDDPRVLRMCDLTGSTEIHICGGLFWLWSAADSHTETGLMPRLTVAAIDRKTGIKGFGAALLEIGWIAETEAGIEIVRFEEHNGVSAKKRAATAKRVQKHKSKTTGNAGCVTENDTTGETGNAVALAERYLEKEKRREEKEEEKREPPDGGSCPELASGPAAEHSPEEDRGEVVLTFPTTGTKSQPRTWSLRQSLVDYYHQAFPAVDIMGECRKAHAWIIAHSSRKKTAGGMQSFLTKWLSKEQDRASTRRNHSRDGPRTMSQQPSGIQALREERNQQRQTHDATATVVDVRRLPGPDGTAGNGDG